MKRNLESLKKIPSKRLVKKVVIAIVLLLGATLLGCYMQKMQRYEALSSRPNQACVGIGIALRNGLTLKHYDFDAHSIVRSSKWHDTGQHKCTIGTVITDQTQHPDGSGSSSGHQLGGDVIYFKSANDAYHYAEKAENPTRYWGVDQQGQRNNIPQTSLFTYLVTDAQEPYFEAYTVRGNTLVHLSLPCNMDTNADPSQAFGKCNDLAEKTLKQFADTVQHNLAGNPL